ncbi:MAG: hypothetical protein C4582_13870 [Desulfobacteraceae bacterium]|jgi:hypothetical protein|nr:MAG: hypothetical protein C4582_13870 [Desulfobacteraceae bacterium]
MNKKFNILLLFFWILLPSQFLYAAVGCDLNDPDRDVVRLFPGSTGYKTNYVSIDQLGGPGLLARIEERLGDKFQGLFETIDVPYTLYEVFKGKDKIGYIHGVNQKGQYGGIQVFVVLDLDGVIRNFYFQKLTSRYGKELRAPKFGQQFVGMTLEDFYRYDVKTGKTTGQSGVAKIVNPVPEAEFDFRAALRGTKKNLILVDEFILGNRHLKYHKSGGEQK